MSLETIFSICNFIVMPQWLMMMFIPKWKGSKWLAKSHIIPILLAVLYLLFLILSSSKGSMEEGGFSSLKGVRSLFSVDEALLSGWIHYLAFDLLVGSWIYRKCLEKGISPWLRIPSLFFTFMFGPIGFLLFYLSDKVFYNKSNTLR
jgi:hypothetical protein